MSIWSKYPFIYEINTVVWLNELSRKYGRPIKLGTVPCGEWDHLGSFGFDAVWLMGVWERSPAGRQIALRNGNLMAEFRKVLPDFTEKDLAGSAYCIRNYASDPAIGGPEGLAHAREMLAHRGMKLVLDFVPNHVAPDHPWTTEHPEYFIRGGEDDLRDNPSAFVREGRNIIALGRDPYFPAWPDVVQLNAFNTGLRAAALRTLSEIAGQCDGVRCDMAMLMMNSVFERTWGWRAGDKPSDDYWPTLISKIKRTSPGFLFIAEAYWNLEWELQQQGFDFCYDKTLYDRMEHSDAQKVRQHLFADMAYQDRMLRFIENHDEPRAAATFTPEKGKMAAVILSTLPGARLFHEGQFEGRKKKVPVFLSRRPDETADQELIGFYHKLLALTGDGVFRSGDWKICEVRGWPDNQGCRNILAWLWQKDKKSYLIIVNFCDVRSDAMVQIPLENIRGRDIRLSDELSGADYERPGTEIADNGLYAALEPWSCHFFKLVLNSWKN